MRVISGEAKGRGLKAVPGNQTRPTTDKVKETLFNIIGPYFDGGQGLDLYSGSGGLGIEAISRGLEKVVFIDQHPAAVQTINENLSRCRFESRSEVFRIDARRALNALAKRKLTFDLIFLDPPYQKQHIIKDIEQIVKLELLRQGTLIIVEHDDKLMLPETFGSALEKWRHHNYNGNTALTIYKSTLDKE